MAAPFPVVLALGITALVFVLIGGSAIAGSAKNRRRRKRILDTPTSLVSRSPGGGRVEIFGRLGASEQGVIVAPFSGRQAVYVRVRVEEYRSRGKSGYWATIVDESDARDFYVDDGSGEYARVHVQSASFELNPQVVSSSGTFRDAPPHLEGFLRSRGKVSTNLFGLNKAMRYSEEVLVPGDTLYALGPSRRDPGPPTASGFRTAQSSQLALFAHRGDENELILTNLSEAALLSKLNSGWVVGLFFIGGGVLLGGFALVLLIASLFI